MIRLEAKAVLSREDDGDSRCFTALARATLHPEHALALRPVDPCRLPMPLGPLVIVEQRNYRTEGWAFWFVAALDPITLHLEEALEAPGQEIAQYERPLVEALEAELRHACSAWLAAARKAREGDLPLVYRGPDLKAGGAS